MSDCGLHSGAGLVRLVSCESVWCLVRLDVLSVSAAGQECTTIFLDMATEIRNRARTITAFWAMDSMDSQIGQYFQHGSQNVIFFASLHHV